MKIKDFLLDNSPEYLRDRVKLLTYKNGDLILLPCPICKHEARLIIGNPSDGYCNYITAFVECTHCRIQTKERHVDGYYGCTDTVNDVINDWNERQ